MITPASPGPTIHRAVTELESRYTSGLDHIHVDIERASLTTTSANQFIQCQDKTEVFFVHIAS